MVITILLTLLKHQIIRHSNAQQNAVYLLLLFAFRFSLKSLE